MAYAVGELSKIVEFGGKTGNCMWKFDTLDTAATVDSAQYFNLAVKELRVGDVIMRTTWSTAVGAGGTISTYGFHIVLSNDGTDVDVADALAGTVTDTD